MVPVWQERYTVSLHLILHIVIRLVCLARAAWELNQLIDSLGQGSMCVMLGQHHCPPKVPRYMVLQQGQLALALLPVLAHLAALISLLGAVRELHTPQLPLQRVALFMHPTCILFGLWLGLQPSATAALPYLSCVALAVAQEPLQQKVLQAAVLYAISILSDTHPVLRPASATFSSAWRCFELASAHMASVLLGWLASCFFLPIKKVDPEAMAASIPATAATASDTPLPLGYGWYHEHWCDPGHLCKVATTRALHIVAAMANIHTCLVNTAMVPAAGSVLASAVRQTVGAVPTAALKIVDLIAPSLALSHAALIAPTPARGVAVASVAPAVTAANTTAVLQIAAEAVLHSDGVLVLARSMASIVLLSWGILLLLFTLAWQLWPAVGQPHLTHALNTMATVLATMCQMMSVPLLKHAMPAAAVASCFRIAVCAILDFAANEDSWPWFLVEAVTVCATSSILHMSIVPDATAAGSYALIAAAGAAVRAVTGCGKLRTVPRVAQLFAPEAVSQWLGAAAFHKYGLQQPYTMHGTARQGCSTHLEGQVSEKHLGKVTGEIQPLQLSQLASAFEATSSVPMQSVLNVPQQHPSALIGFNVVMPVLASHADTVPEPQQHSLVYNTVASSEAQSPIPKFNLEQALHKFRPASAPPDASAGSLASLPGKERLSKPASPWGPGTAISQLEADPPAYANAILEGSSSATPAEAQLLQHFVAGTQGPCASYDVPVIPGIQQTQLGPSLLPAAVPGAASHVMPYLSSWHTATMPSNHAQPFSVLPHGVQHFNDIMQGYSGWHANVPSCQQPWSQDMCPPDLTCTTLYHNVQHQPHAMQHDLPQPPNYALTFKSAASAGELRSTTSGTPLAIHAQNRAGQGQQPIVLVGHLQGIQAVAGCIQQEMTPREPADGFGHTSDTNQMPALGSDSHAVLQEYMVASRKHNHDETGLPGAAEPLLATGNRTAAASGSWPLSYIGLPSQLVTSTHGSTAFDNPLHEHIAADAETYDRLLSTMPSPFSHLGQSRSSQSMPQLNSEQPSQSTSQSLGLLQLANALSGPAPCSLRSQSGPWLHTSFMAQPLLYQHASMRTGSQESLLMQQGSPMLQGSSQPQLLDPLPDGTCKDAEHPDSLHDTYQASRQLLPALSRQPMPPHEAAAPLPKLASSSNNDSLQLPALDANNAGLVGIPCMLPPSSAPVPAHGDASQPSSWLCTTGRPLPTIYSTNSIHQSDPVTTNSSSITHDPRAADGCRSVSVNILSSHQSHHSQVLTNGSDRQSQRGVGSTHPSLSQLSTHGSMAPNSVPSPVDFVQTWQLMSGGGTTGSFVHHSGSLCSQPMPAHTHLSTGAHPDRNNILSSPLSNIASSHNQGLTFFQSVPSPATVLSQLPANAVANEEIQPMLAADGSGASPPILMLQQPRKVPEHLVSQGLAYANTSGSHPADARMQGPAPSVSGSLSMAESGAFMLDDDNAKLWSSYCSASTQQRSMDSVGHGCSGPHTPPLHSSGTRRHGWRKLLMTSRSSGNHPSHHSGVPSHPRPHVVDLASIDPEPTAAAAAPSDIPSHDTTMLHQLDHLPNIRPAGRSAGALRQFVSGYNRLFRRAAAPQSK